MIKVISKFGLQTFVFLCVLGIASKFAGPASILIAIAVAHKVLR